jgi:pimeloyl-ACP methyl ester carboxylesterase
MTLEILSHVPQDGGSRQPLLFVHGAYTGAWCWDEYFLPWFSMRGHPACAVSLRGHGASPSGAALDLAGLDDYVTDTLSAAAMFEQRPILIGHSMGALVVQRAARKCNAAALVLLAPVPPHGLASSVWSLASRDPALFFALNAMQIGGGVTNGMRSVRDYLFSQTLSEHDVTRYLMRLQRESQRALFELAWPQHLWIASAVGIPTLVLGAEGDAFFTRAMIEETAWMHRVSPTFFPDMAHVMMLEPGWRNVAERIAAWVEKVAPATAM